MCLRYLLIIEAIEVNKMKERRKENEKYSEGSREEENLTRVSTVMSIRLYISCPSFELIKSSANYYRFPNLTPSSRRSREAVCITSEIEGEIDLSQGEHEFTDEWIGLINVIIVTSIIDFLVDDTRVRWRNFSIDLYHALRKSLRYAKHIFLRAFYRLYYVVKSRIRSDRKSRITTSAPWWLHKRFYNYWL